MQPKELPRAEQFAAQKHRRRIWQKVVTCMACVVVFCTVYALILPAITLEPEPVCGLEEHVHDESCYTVTPAVYEEQLSCLTASLIHQHTAGCYNENGDLICGQADYVIHYHDSSCYDAAGNLVCPLPVVTEHVHTEECYSAMEGHIHTEDCYALQETLTCGLEESDGHLHDEGCYDETGALICGLEEQAGHIHSAECYTEEEVLICGLEETEGVEPELICELKEVIPHIHEAGCYDGAGNLICGRLETRVHQHGESCFTQVEVSPAQAVLTCGLPEHVHTDSCYPQQEPTPDPVEEEPAEEEPAEEEAPLTEAPVYCGKEAHTHTEECYWYGQLACELEEHTHTEECYVPPIASDADPNAGLETRVDWEATMQDVRLTGEYRQDLLAIAESQLGYTACAENYILDENGQEKRISRYGQWYGDPYGDWCAMFVSFCLHYAEVDGMPLDANCQKWIETLSKPEYELFYETDGQMPVPADLVFFDYNRDGMADHVGLVYTVTEATETEPAQLETIERGPGDQVQIRTYSLPDEDITGYASLPVNAWIVEVIAMIDALPTSEEAEAALAAWKEAGDEDGYEAYYAELYAQAKAAHDAYETLKDEQKAQVTNADKLLALEWLWSAPSPDGTCSLTALTETGIAVTVSGPADALPYPWEEVTLTVSEITSETAEHLRDQALEEEGLTAEKNYLFDITLWHDGQQIEPLAPLTLRFHGLPLAGTEAPKVYHIDEEAEQATDMNAVLDEEDNVVLDTDHFSTYSVSLLGTGTSVNNAAGLKSAIEAGDSSIQLVADFTVSEALSIPANAAITLDLNGHTLTASGSGALFTISAGAVLIITDSQQKAEMVTSDSSNIAGNTASLSNDSLTYYVTTTGITNSGTGATSESLEKHTVSVSGSILGGSQPVFQITGGTLNLESGMIRGGTGRAIVQTGGTSNLSGGYICGFVQSSNKTDNTSFGGAIKISDGSLSLSGGVLAANTAHNGGAVYATGSAQISITGGVISGNTSNRTTSGWNDHSESGAYRCGGGGIYADGNASLTMSGGYITNNTATHDGYFDGGGGVCLSGTSSMALSGGYVTGNQAQGGGGVRTDFGKGTTFVMTGGFVSANVATHAEGGGIAIDRNGVGTVTGGYITNNQIPNTGHWGGGGLFCADGSTLNLKNTLITNNTAGGFGAGVAGCPTGNLYLYVTEGCAIFDNTDTVDGDSPHFTSDGVKQIDKEICTEVFQSNGHADYFCALNSTVTGTMLGNNAANWQGSSDYQPVIADAEDLLTATRVMGLKANPAETAKSAAQSAAKVYINGNYSYTHGGGIMCNGNLVIGVPVNIEVPARVELQATKLLTDGSGNAQSLEDNDFSFKVTMTEVDGTVIASGTCDSSGKITFDHQLTFKQEGTFVYYVYEEADEENVSVTYDSTLYRLTMTVTKDSGVAWYGDTIKYSYNVTSIKVESSTNGETWTQVSQSDTSQSGVISLPLTSGTTFTNHLIEPTKITVQKKWEGGNSANSATVILKKDGEEFNRQTLNAGNNWTYTWDNLETGHSYTVEEVPIEGYTASYEITTSTDTSGSASLGQGSWWVPASQLTAGQQYLIVSPDGTKALCIASGNEGQGFDTADVTSVVQQQTALTVNGQTYSTWYQAADIPARSIYNAEALTRNSHSGIVLKRSDGGSYPYLRLESNNNNYLKGASSTTYASFMVFDGNYLRGHNTSEWTLDALRTIIYADGKFNSTTEQSPANAVKLYTLVSGEAFTGTTTDSSTVIITNTWDGSNEYVLPETGGPGVYLYTISGIVLMAGALMYLSLRRRKGAGTS